MPALFLAMSSIVGPRIYIWSIPIDVKTDVDGFTILVVSFYPPIPTYKDTISQLFSLKYTKAEDAKISHKL